MKGIKGRKLIEGKYEVMMAEGVVHFVRLKRRG
jgi:hypothetical protein